MLFLIAHVWLQNMIKNIETMRKVLVSEIALGVFPKYSGITKIPKKVYEGDSKNIVIELQLISWANEKDEILQIMKVKDGLNLTFSAFDDIEYLEFELIAAGFVIKGEAKQRQPVTSDFLRYYWNCYFPNSGNHTFALVFRPISSAAAPNSDLFAKWDARIIEQTINVVKLDHLTQREVWFLASIAALISGSLTIAEILHRLGTW